ncbi:methyl-accepting chemotaxis protein [Desulfotomaculum arcticum]|uniref:Methyl-accepting chemotaxis protein n=1 Tax=Desulfotruncus arcticus DSM 17038 TaxID=1121424 RepID=A0A1I2Q4A4_9FIRM|nr:HAMP domain-containing methyl-accepting chemotaxis protein [Desulfotruncus arcticus]SFG23315.1 methyl-accepting chemotaxis protein [Desulfotomaculum arcticum] [Desulfotruncus arcticus DSM 17038]
MEILVGIEEKNIQEQYAQQAKNFYEARNTMFGVAGVIILIGIVIAFIFARSISHPVSQLARAADLASSGDLTVDIPVKSRDEVGILAESFRKMVVQVRDLVGQIMEKAHTVAGSAGQLTASAQQTAAGANESSAAMSQISSTVERVSANINQIKAASDSASGFAAKGAEGISRFTGQMQIIAGSAGEAAAVIDGFSVKSREIGQIVELITDIAEQTNLLALNAAIEAARAGEQGRGFAVVAEEVRKLAEQSADAAKEIYGLVNAIQLESQKAVDIMAQGGKNVAEGDKVVQEVGQNFKDIIGAVQGLNGQISEVATAAGQMASGIQVAVASTEEQTASMEEVSASAESLNNLAADLTALVKKFKV